MKCFHLWPNTGGGVLIAIRNLIPCKQLQSPDGLEVATVSLCFAEPITLCMVYSAYPLQILLSTMKSYLSQVSDTLETVFIMGDFNSPNIDWSTLEGTCLLSSMLCDLSYNLSQLVNEPTHKGGNFLDLGIHQNKEECICQLSVEPVELQPVTSDHFSVTITTKLRYPTSKTSPHYVFRKQTGQLYVTTFWITISPCVLTSNDVEIVWWIIKSAILNALPLFVRLR